MKHIILALILFSFTSLSQTPDPLTYGRVSMDELLMKTYPKDSTAEAVVLADYAQTHYEFGDQIKIFTERIVRIKILKRTGFHWATGYIHFYQKDDAFDYVEKIEGATHNLENGREKVYELSKNAIFDNKESSGWHEMKFTFPQVQEGSVIEYHYELSSTRWYHLNDWRFQAAIPTQWSEHRIRIPGYFDFKITLQSYQELAVNELINGKAYFLRSNIEDPYINYRFAMKDIPALPEGEPFITTLEDYRYKISFELARTFFPQTGEKNYSVSYQDMTKTLLEADYFGGALKKFRKTAEKLLEGYSIKPDTLQNVTVAIGLIKQKMRWNNEARFYADENNLSKVLEKGLGNSAEINLMLVGLLRAMGYEANPVILSTRSHGKISPDFALLNRFNYTVAHLSVGDKDMLLDATDPYMAVGMLPIRCLNKQGWLVHATKARWVSLIPKNNHTKYIVMDMKIGEQQQVKSTTNINYTGYAAADFRSEVLEMGKDKFLENYKKKFVTWQSPNITLEHLDDTGESVKMLIETTINEAYTQAGDRIYLQPLMGLGLQANPFKVQSRTYPIDFGYGSSETYKITYTIPDNYVVEELPTNLSASLGDVSNRFFYDIKQQGNQVVITHYLSLRKTYFEPDTYQALRNFYDKIVSKHAEQIILKKK